MAAISMRICGACRAALFGAVLLGSGLAHGAQEGFGGRMAGASALLCQAGAPATNERPGSPAATRTFDGPAAVRLLVWTAGFAAVCFALRLLVREALARRVDRRQSREHDWDIGDDYPYCTEPPDPDELVYDVKEPVELTRPLLRQLEWKRFEELVCAYYAALGFEAQPTRSGAAGGVDIYLYRPGEHRPCTYVECKSSINRGSAAKLVRELADAMAADDVPEGVLVTAGEIGVEARSLAADARMQLIDGELLVERFGTLRVEERDRILRQVMRGDYRAPTCPGCGEKMVLRNAETKPFWGCVNQPRCQRKIAVRLPS